MSLITCPECKSEISDEAHSCPKCGFPFKVDRETNYTADKGKREKPRRKTRKWLIMVLLLFGAIAALVILRIDALINKPGSGSRISVLDIIPQERQLRLFDGSIIVGAGSRNYHEFSTLKSWRKIHVKGSFRASGGSGNDIRLFLMTKNNFTNFINGHEATSLYDSGQLTVSDFDVPLPSESQNYVLAFTNVFSTFSDKGVNAKISLFYTF